jgi:hypothetical protein
MFHNFGKGLFVLALLAPLPVLADIIHWEVHSDEDVPAYMDENFVLDGSFDFDLATGSISNITIRTSAIGCVACNDFSDGGAGKTYSFPDGRGGVEFTENYAPSDQTLGRHYWLQISGENSFEHTLAFDVSRPGTYEGLGIWHWGQILLDDPFDPDLFEDVSCESCAHAVGTLIPVPEPETYVMLLAGLGVLGWQARRGLKSGAS